MLGADRRRGVEDAARERAVADAVGRRAPPGRSAWARWTTVVAPSNSGLRSAVARSTGVGLDPAGSAGETTRRSSGDDPADRGIGGRQAARPGAPAPTPRR